MSATSSSSSGSSSLTSFFYSVLATCVVWGALDLFSRASFNSLNWYPDDNPMASKFLNVFETINGALIELTKLLCKEIAAKLPTVYWIFSIISYGLMLTTSCGMIDPFK